MFYFQQVEQPHCDQRIVHQKVSRGCLEVALHDLQNDFLPEALLTGCLGAIALDPLVEVQTIAYMSVDQFV
tara:strand:- start:1309 stop:1521 length:213 start_codon:yes stop_codon:yes gene_type:complete